MISVKKTLPLTFDTIRDDSIKVNISTIADVDTVGNCNFEASNQHGIQTKCVRCGHLLDESESLFITVHPAIRNPEFSLSTDCLGNIKEAYSCANETSNSYNGHEHFKSKYLCTEPTSEEIQKDNIGTCDKYQLNRNHPPAVGNSEYNFNRTIDLGNGSFGFANDNYEPSKSICLQTKSNNLEIEQNTTKTFDKCKLKRTNPESLQVIAVKNFSNSNDCECDSTVSYPKNEPVVNLCSSTPCADCHIALVFNYPEKPSDQKLSLMFQVSQKPMTVQKYDKETQTESISEVNRWETLVDVGTETSIPNIPYMYQENTAVSDQDSSPDKDGPKLVSPSQVKKITPEKLTSSDDENVNQSLAPEKESTQHGLKGNPDRSLVEKNPAVSESAENIDSQKSILESTPYPNPTQVKQVSEGKLPGKSGYKDPLPELSRANEAAYQAHLNSLVPCNFCGRRFISDRVMVHEGACIERPKKRTYIAPNKKNLK